MITIVDYGMGNLGSVQNMFKYIKVQSEITSDLRKVEQAEKLLLPGVGAFDPAMKLLRETGIQEVLNYKALEQKIPVLGICLGMQLLTKGSEEGVLPGLGWIEAHSHKFDSNNSLKVPHMGWNIAMPGTASALTKGLNNESRFYFVHTYYVKAKNPANSILRTSYGVEFDSGLQNDNIYGVQFHPEKSHKFGMKILENFSLI